MKPTRLLTVSTAFLLFLMLLISQTKLSSHVAQPDAGYVNDPDPSGALTCANSGCHSGTAISDSTMFTVTMGLFSAGTGSQSNVVSGLTTYNADSVYYMSVTGNGTAPRYGFELTVVDAASSPGNMAGAITLTNTNNTTRGQYQPNGSTMRYYAGHKNANTTHSWTFKWTAPHTGTGPLTIYYVGMNSNGNGNNSGDLVYKSTRVISEASIVNGIDNMNSKLSSLTVYPSLFSADLTLSLNLPGNMKVKAELIDISGNAVSELMNEEISSGLYSRSFHQPDIASGIYFLKLQSGNNTIVRKIVKQ